VTDFGAYVKALCGQLAEMQSPDQSNIKMICESEPLLLDLKRVTSLGLIVAELVTNSFDHAFPGGAGTIVVDMRWSRDEPQTAVLIVRDDGVGFEADPNSARHGLGLIRRLVEQIRGTVSVESDNKTVKGTLWSVNFPVPPHIQNTG
jgi:two-component sensor histidine kinase